MSIKNIYKILYLYKYNSLVMPENLNHIVCGEETAKLYNELVKEAEFESQKKQVEKYVKTHMNKKIDTGMIMDAVNMSEQNYANKDTMNAAIENDQLKKLEVLAKQYQLAHTQKVREYKKVGRNDLCPCGSGKKYKNCCLSLGKYENIIMKK